MKKDIQKGLAGILAPTPVAQKKAQPQAEQTATPEKVKGNYKTVCYSLPPEVTEKIKDIAYWDRKKINAVVTEALEVYIAKWNENNNK